MLLLDTSAWIEYFVGSPRGEKIKNILEGGEETATSIISLIELSCKSCKEGADFSQQIDFIKGHSVIIYLNDDTALSVGKLYAEMKARNKKTSLADAIIATTAKLHTATVVTCDTDFIGLDNIKLVS